MQQGAGRKPYRARLRFDADFFLELQYCVEHGIPHSTFLKWESTDRAKAIAYQMEKSERCQMCGTAGWEWQENRFAYEPVEEFCKGCYLKHVANEDAGQIPGTSISLMPTGTIEADRRHLKQQRREQERS